MNFALQNILYEYNKHIDALNTKHLPAV